MSCLNRIGSRTHRIRCASRHAGLLAVMLVFAFPRTAAWADTPQGQWLIDGRVVVQIFDCGVKMCGRILWLKVPRNPQGQLDQDNKNPNTALRNRQLCGLTILWNLQPDGSDRWKDGWFYNPDDGKTYRVTAQLKSSTEMVARIMWECRCSVKPRSSPECTAERPRDGAEPTCAAMTTQDR
jgi:uncharacterized protein (DUF2147 family)